MSEDRSNKNSSSDDAIGILHQSITTSLDLKLTMQLAKVKDKLKKTKKAAKKKGKKVKIKDLSFMISTSDILAAAKWCQQNKIISRDSTIKEVLETHDELAAIRERMNKHSHKLKAVGDE
jgi:hypothetical protein